MFMCISILVIAIIILVIFIVRDRRLLEQGKTGLHPDPPGYVIVIVIVIVIVLRSCRQRLESPKHSSMKHRSAPKEMNP